MFTGRVGEIEDEIFLSRKRSEENEERKRASWQGRGG
jgi:hypothetical protein